LHKADNEYPYSNTEKNVNILVSLDCQLIDSDRHRFIAGHEQNIRQPTGYQCEYGLTDTADYCCEYTDQH
jgi:hypothetical protein